MSQAPTITQDELIARIKTRLESAPYRSSHCDFELAPDPTAAAAYALILGAGFSHGVVPMVRELMHETIGGYYFPDQEQSSADRGAEVLRRNSADFWRLFNEAAAKASLPTVELDAGGLPEDCGAAYQRLFTYEVAGALIARQPKPEPTFVERLAARRHAARGPREPSRGQDLGARFVKGFLRYVVDPGAEHGYGSTGRTSLNPAHIYLAALLEAQQLGRAWKTCAFARTIFTTNFDTLLQNCLQMVNLSYRLTDRPETGLDAAEFLAEEAPIHLVYVHGSILRHNPASTTQELGVLERGNVDVLRERLETRDVIAIGYGGWNDGLMAALRKCAPDRHALYWCDVRPAPAPHVAAALGARTAGSAYVRLGETGADDLMRGLYEALVPPEGRRDPLQRYRAWSDLVWNRDAGARA